MIIGMKKLISLTCVCVLFNFVLVNKTFAQYYFYDKGHYDNPFVFEVGASIAAMNCLTDLGGTKGIGKKFVKDLNLGNTQLAGSFYLSTLYKSTVGIRLEATFGQVRAYDSILKKVAPTTFGRYERNLSFRSKITELALIAEIHPLYLINNYNADNDKTPPTFSPYILGGIGFFSFNPQARLNNRWVDLQPLSTEGQGFVEYPNRRPYQLKQMNMPVGFGVKYELTRNLIIRSEMMYRILTTDYLDDVSTTYIDPALYPDYFTGAKLVNAFLLNDRQRELDPFHITRPGDQRGDPEDNDAYFTFNIKIGYTFGRDRVKDNRGKLSCPSF